MQFKELKHKRVVISVIVGNTVQSLRGTFDHAMVLADGKILALALEDIPQEKGLPVNGFVNWDMICWIEEENRGDNL